MVYKVVRRSKRPYFKNGRTFYPRRRSAEKVVQRKDERILFDKNESAFYVKRVKFKNKRFFNKK